MQFGNHKAGARCESRRQGGLTSLGEELARVFAVERDVFRDRPEQLDDMCEVVLIPRVVLPGVRLKQVVTRRQLKGLKYRQRTVRPKQAQLRRGQPSSLGFSTSDHKYTLTQYDQGILSPDNEGQTSSPLGVS